MDTKGPEIRTTTNVDDENVVFTAGMEVDVAGEPESLTSVSRICLSYPDIANDVKEGMHLLIDDGELDFLIEKIDGGVLKCRVQNDGELGSRKSVNIPGASIKLPSLTQRDITKVHPEEIIAAARCAVETGLNMRRADVVKEVVNLFGGKRTKAVTEWIEKALDLGIAENRLMLTVDDIMTT